MRLRRRPRQHRRVVPLWLLVACTACTPARPVAAPAPTAEPGLQAEPLIRESVPTGPRTGRFDWTLKDAAVQFRGRGVVRFEAPERVRLDLFGPRGETLVAAALVGDSVRFPGRVPDAVRLPPRALLWAALGIVVPGRAGPVAAGLTGADTVLTAAEAGATLRWVLRGRQITRAERVHAGRISDVVELERDPDGTPRRARYRDYSVPLRILVLSFSDWSNAEPFPPEIWQIGARP